MHSVELLVSLKIPDVTALTARNSLRRRMGFRDTLQTLQRSDYYLLQLRADAPEAVQTLARELAEQTNFFVNPNKHAYRLRLPGAEPTPRQEGDLWVVEVLVTDAEGASAPDIVAALEGRLGYGERVAGVSRGVLWTLGLACAAAAEARALAERIVVTRSREQGLLINPHFQSWQVL